MVIVDLHGQLLEGSRKVTSEISMHLAVYGQRQDLGAVVHSHPQQRQLLLAQGEFSMRFSVKKQ
jgi:ribulose-5-phosphate 4-epimerase/fuculose-1-phosphate aldolase